MNKNNNIITSVQQEIADILNADATLSSVGFLIENRWDIENEIQKNLKKIGVCGLVMTPTLEFAGIDQNHNIVYELPDLIVQIVEYVPMNRASNKQNCMTCQDIAVQVAEVLGPQSANWQNIQLVSIETGEDNNLMVTKVTFKALIRKAKQIKPVVWGTGTFTIENIEPIFVWDNDLGIYSCSKGQITEDARGITISLAPGQSYQSTNFDPTKSEQIVNFVPFDAGEPVDLNVKWTE